MLNEKQKNFVFEYMKDFNATQAAIRAGYSANTAYSQGQRLLKHVEVRKAVEAAKEKRAKRADIDADYVLRQAVRLHERCMGDTGEPFHSTGAVRALELIGKHVSVQAFREQMGLSNPAGGPIEIAEIPASKRLSHLIDKLSKTSQDGGK